MAMAFHVLTGDLQQKVCKVNTALLAFLEEFSTFKKYHNVITEDLCNNMHDVVTSILDYIKKEPQICLLKQNASNKVGEESSKAIITKKNNNSEVPTDQFNQPSACSTETDTNVLSKLKALKEVLNNNSVFEMKPCKLCKQVVIGDKNVLESHIRDFHPLLKHGVNDHFRSTGVYYCHLCMDPLGTGVDMIKDHLISQKHQNHFSNVIKTNNDKDQKFILSNILDNKIYWSIPIVSLKCNHCKKIIVDNQKTCTKPIYHIQEHKEFTGSSTNLKNHFEQSTELIYCCKLCEAIFAKEKNFLKHYQKCHSSETTKMFELPEIQNEVKITKLTTEKENFSDVGNVDTQRVDNDVKKENQKVDNNKKRKTKQKQAKNDCKIDVQNFENVTLKAIQKSDSNKKEKIGNYISIETQKTDNDHREFDINVGKETQKSDKYDKKETKNNGNDEKTENQNAGNHDRKGIQNISTVTKKNTQSANKEEIENNKDDNKNDEDDCDSDSTSSYKSIEGDKLIEIINAGKLDEYIRETILESEKQKNSTQHKIVIEEIENTLKPYYPNVKAMPYGPVFYGFGGLSNIILIYIDIDHCYLRWPGYTLNKTKLVIERIMNHLGTSWNELELVSFDGTSRPLLYAKHKDHPFDYSFNCINGIKHYKTILLMNFLDRQPICQTLSIILLRAADEVKGFKSPYAIILFVVFYLQIRNHLPSVHSLQIKENTEKVTIGPWSTNLESLLINEYETEKLSTDNYLDILKDLLQFYITFDYKNNVICPYVGRLMQKNQFKDPPLPEEFKRLEKFYIFEENGKLNINNPICLQDPIELNENVTEHITEKSLNQFLLCLEELYTTISTI